jgi:hypothetical protein
MSDHHIEPAQFVELLAQLNAVSNQQTMQVLQVASLAMQLKGMSEMDMTQAVIESKMASLLNPGGRGAVRPSPINEVKP